MSSRSASNSRDSNLNVFSVPFPGDGGRVLHGVDWVMRVDVIPMWSELSWSGLARISKQDK